MRNLEAFNTKIIVEYYKVFLRFSKTLPSHVGEKRIENEFA